MIHFGTFIASKSKRNMFHEEQLKQAFMSLAEDAEDSLARIKAALSFSANLQGPDKKAIDAVLKELNK